MLSFPFSIYFCLIFLFFSICSEDLCTVTIQFNELLVNSVAFFSAFLRISTTFCIRISSNPQRHSEASVPSHRTEESDRKKGWLIQQPIGMNATVQLIGMNATVM